MGNPLIPLIFAVAACVAGLSALVILWVIWGRLNDLISDVEDIKNYVANNRDLLDTMAKAVDLAIARLDDRIDKFGRVE